MSKSIQEQYAELFQVEGEHTGLMVAVWLDPSLAERLAVAGGQAAESLHITLCYCGDANEMGDVALARAISHVASVAENTSPLSGQIAGLGRFNATPSSDGKDVLYANVDVPGLERIRQTLADMLSNAGCPPLMNHGYTPHVTLAYLEPEAEAPVERVPTLPISIKSIWVSVGERKAEMPLAGRADMARFAEWSTAYLNDLPDGSFLYVEPGEKDGGGKTVPRSKRHFPFKDANGKVDLSHLRNAIARIPQSTAPGLTAEKKQALQERARRMLQRMQRETAEREHNVADLAASGGEWRLFMDTGKREQYIEPPEWLPLLPKPGTFQHPSYGKVVVSPERNARFIDNLKRGVYQKQIPIDAEHDLRASGALGWIVDGRINEDGSADGRVEWNERGKAMLKDDRFRYVSPHWYETWTAPDTGQQHQDVLIGLGLTTRPFYKESSLRPLVASEQGLHISDGEIDPSAETVIVFFEQLHPMEVREMAENRQPNEQGQTVTAAQFTELQGQFTELKGQFAASEAARKEAESKAQQYQEALDKSNARVAALEQDARRKRFAETVKDWYGEAAKNVAMLEKLAEAFGEESEDFKGFVAQQKAIAAQMAESKLFVEVGHDREQQAQSAGERIEAEARRLMAEDTALTLAQAVAAAAERNPQLYAEYVSEMRGGR